MEDLSLVIPVYNNSGALRQELPALIDYLKGLGLSWQIVLSDDGSHDATSTEKLGRDFNCRLVRAQCNQGKGAAVRRGMLAADGRYRVFTDADIPFEFDAIARFVGTLMAAEADVVTGDRREESGSQYLSQISGWRRMGSQIFSRLANALVPEAGPDTQCGLKGFTDSAAIHLFSLSRISRYAFDVEILYLAHRLGYRTQFLPVTLRSTGTSQVSVVSDGIRMLYDLGRIAYYSRSAYALPPTALTRRLSQPMADQSTR